MVDIPKGGELTRAWVDAMSPTWLRHHRLRCVYGHVLTPTTDRPADKPCDCERCREPWKERDALVEGDRRSEKAVTDTEEGKAALDRVQTFQREAATASSVEAQRDWLGKCMDVLNESVGPLHPAHFAVVEMLMTNALARGKAGEAIDHARTLAYRRPGLKSCVSIPALLRPLSSPRNIRVAAGGGAASSDDPRRRRGGAATFSQSDAASTVSPSAAARQVQTRAALRAAAAPADLPRLLHVRGAHSRGGARRRAQGPRGPRAARQGAGPGKALPRLQVVATGDARDAEDRAHRRRPASGRLES